MLTRRRGQRLALALALVAVGAALAARASLVPAKALVAQVLLRRAWSRALGGERAPKAWPWADTWPVARLRLPGHGADLLVLAGTHGEALAFGPGHDPRSTPPGEDGNVVMAGHRDTHFAVLRDVRPGDEAVLETPAGARRTYHVRSLEVVSSRRGDLALAGGGSRLTLVTCWPFDAVAAGGDLRCVVIADEAPGSRRRGEEGEEGQEGEAGERLDARCSLLAGEGAQPWPERACDSSSSPSSSRPAAPAARPPRPRSPPCPCSDSRARDTTSRR